jgi:hypothetical protein
MFVCPFGVCVFDPTLGKNDLRSATVRNEWLLLEKDEPFVVVEIDFFTLVQAFWCRGY